MGDDAHVRAEGTPRSTEDDLTALALAAPPMAVPADDAVPMAVYLGQGTGLLPDWYMPPPMSRMGMSRVHPRWRLPVVLVLVGAFLVIEAFGLCSTFGQVVPA
jgi:hypothetical protein